MYIKEQQIYISSARDITEEKDMKVKVKNMKKHFIKKL